MPDRVLYTVIFRRCFNYVEGIAISLFICPICGKQNSIRYYDPQGFSDDITVIVKRGLGKGKGFEVVAEYSLLDGSNPELLDMISDRIAVIYDMLYEDEEEEYEDISDPDEEINE